MWGTFGTLAGVPDPLVDPKAALHPEVPAADSVDVSRALMTLGGASGRADVAIDVGAWLQRTDGAGGVGVGATNGAVSLHKLVANMGTESKDYWVGPQWPAFMVNGSAVPKEEPKAGQLCSAQAPCLFDVLADPEERTNLAKTNASDPAVQALLKSLGARMDASDKTAFQTGDDDYNVRAVGGVGVQHGWRGCSTVLSVGAVLSVCAPCVPAPPPGLTRGPHLACFVLANTHLACFVLTNTNTHARARQGNFTNCTTNDAFKAANGGFLGPMCYACLAPPCTPPAPPSPTPGPSKPTPAPPASLVRLQSASSAGMCLVAAAGSKSAVVQLVECTAARARCWSVEKGKGLFYLGSGFCLRPQNPPKVPASCVAGQPLMIGENACMQAALESLHYGAEGYELTSDKCPGLCASATASKAAGPGLGPCSGGANVTWTMT
jgi:hypothetical protein